MIDHDFVGRVPDFSFFGCLGAVYVRDSFPPENDALSWPNNEASFEELFETGKILSREIDFPPFWASTVKHKTMQKNSDKRAI